MRRSLLKRPSPGLVLAVVALFVALGGGAWAATSSDTKQDKKIAKKAAKSYFKAHIGGASVSHANTAGSATSATSASNATNAANLNGMTRFRTTLAPSGSSITGANQVTLYTDGPLSLVGKCWTDSTPAINAEIDVRSTVAGHWSAYDNSSSTNGSSTNEIGPGTDQDATENDAVATSSQADFQGPFDGTFAVIADDGSAFFTGLTSVGANLGGNGKCTFAGYAISS